MPSLIYLKFAAAALAFGALLTLYFWISNAFTERDKLRISDAAKTAQVAQYQESLARDAQLRKGINEAISNIQVTSNNYIKTVDGGKAPPVPDGTRLQLVAGGLLDKSPSLPPYANHSTNTRRPVTQAD